ncbi:hypothetical protein H0H87_010628 [Tephrocybe sp. NHM501043]|nr:hypothetical protein H0H87_010628 [Tephrocybe sp. NHM501043]
MAEHGVDGVFLQRFASQCDLEAGCEGIRRIRDEVGDRVREAAEKEGRVFAIMYDVSGVPADRIQKILERDWVHLIRNQGILDSPNYLREKGKPVVALWGFGFENAGHTPALVRAVTAYIRNVTPGGAYIMAGTPAHWRTAESDADRNPGFLDVWLNEFDAISPWTVGRYRTEKDADDFADTKMKGDGDLIKRRNEEGQWRKIDYIPVVLPGGSGFNMSQGNWGFNDIKRNGGRFLWQQIFNAKRQGVRTMYGAMWDEYDEGTAFMPIVEKKRMLPVSDKYLFLSLDEEGYDLPSDWYMRICGFAAEGLRGDRRIFESFPSKELQDYWSSRPTYEDVDHKSGDFVSGSSKTVKGDGGSDSGEGQSYQDWLAAQKEAGKDEPPPPPYSLEADEGPSTQTPTTPSVARVSGNVSAVAESHTAETQVAEPVVISPPHASPSTTTTTAIEVMLQHHPVPARQATGPPPVNATSRPQHHHDSSPLVSGGPSPTPDTNDTYSAHTYSNTPSTSGSTHPLGATIHDPIAALTNDFNRHGLGPSDPRQSSSPPPPVHASRPATTQIHADWSGHTQSQAGFSQTGSPTTSSYPPTQTPTAQSGGSWSQGQWPPPEWGISKDPRQQSSGPANQSTYPSQISGGANLSRPQTLSTSPYPLSSSPRPHSAMNTRPLYPISSGSPAPDHAGGLSYGPAPSTYAPGGSHSFHRSGTSTYTPGGPPFPPSGPSFPSAPGSVSPYSLTSSYPGQVGSSPYGTSDYPPPASRISPFGSSPPHSPGPGGLYYPDQTPGHGYPATQGSSYPGQSSYGGGPPYDTPHGTGYPSNGAPPEGGGFHLPLAPGRDNYLNSSQPGPQSSGYSPSYISGSASYGTSSTIPPSASNWYPGSSGGPAPPPVHPGRPTQSPYSNTPNPSPSPWFPTTSPGLLGSVLNTADRVAGKKTRDQIQSYAQFAVLLPLYGPDRPNKGYYEVKKVNHGE